MPCHAGGDRYTWNYFVSIATIEVWFIVGEVNNRLVRLSKCKNMELLIRGFSPDDKNRTLTLPKNHNLLASNARHVQSHFIDFFIMFYLFRTTATAVVIVENLSLFSPSSFFFSYIFLFFVCVFVFVFIPFTLPGWKMWEGCCCSYKTYVAHVPTIHSRIIVSKFNEQAEKIFPVDSTLQIFNLP